MPSSCALLGGFAIGARVSLLWHHIAECEMSASACTRCMPVLAFIQLATFLTLLQIGSGPTKEYLWQ